MKKALTIIQYWGGRMSYRYRKWFWGKNGRYMWDINQYNIDKNKWDKI